MLVYEYLEESYTVMLCNVLPWEDVPLLGEAQLYCVAVPTVTHVVAL